MVDKIHRTSLKQLARPWISLAHLYVKLTIQTMQLPGHMLSNLVHLAYRPSTKDAIDSGNPVILDTVSGLQILNRSPDSASASNNIRQHNDHGSLRDLNNLLMVTMCISLPRRNNIATWETRKESNLRCKD